MNNREVAHRWAHQGPHGSDEGKGSNFYYVGPRLWSYGSHFLLGMHHKNRLVLINEQGYSATTRKHKSFALNALYGNGLTIIEVPKPDPKDSADHKENIDFLIKEQEDRLLAIGRARTRLDGLLGAAENAQQFFPVYLKAFDIKKAPKFPKVNRADVDKYIARAKVALEKARLLAKKREEARRLAEAENLLKWRKGENVQNNFYASDIALRVSTDGQEIETSRGARCSLSAGLVLFRMWRAGRPIEGMQCGLYHVNKATPEGVQIGCHYLKAEEINNFFANFKA